MIRTAILIGILTVLVHLKGVVVGQGDTIDEALTDTRSAIQFHVETFGAEVLEDEPLDVVVADIALPA